MRGLLPRAVCPVISGLLDAWVSHPSSVSLREPPSPSRGEGIVCPPVPSAPVEGQPAPVPQHLLAGGGSGR